MNELLNVLRQIHQTGTVKGYSPWAGDVACGGGTHRSSSAINKNVDVCLNCQRKKCTGKCASLKNESK